MGGGIGGEGGCGWEGDSGEGECSVELEDANGSDSAGRGTGAMAQRRTQPERKRSPRRETGIRAVVMLAWMSVGRADGAETEHPGEGRAYISNCATNERGPPVALIVTHTAHSIGSHI